MGLRFFKLLTLILVGLALPLFVWMAMPGPQASAQCGTKASSCKTCHEVQGKLRVNTKGDWHIQHSFGDFCVFCHAGNAKASDKATAHKGMVKPLDDVSASCAACHESDCNVRADKYAKVLGVTVGTGSGGSSAPRGQAPLSAFVPQVAGVGDQSALPAQSPFTESSAPSSDTTTDERAVNWGNVALAAIAFALLLGGGGFVFWNERQRSASSDLNKLIVTRPELGELMPMLVKADPQTVQVITRTLAERSKRA